MMTLKELNEKAWYRFLKVVYVFLLFPYLLLMVVVFNNFGMDLHEKELPPTPREAFDDLDFHKLSDYMKRNILEEIDEDFRGLPYSEQKKVIDDINNNPRLQGRKKKNYIYISYYSWNFERCAILFLVVTLIYWGIIEAIKRAFYYVVIGRIFPRKE